MNKAFKKYGKSRWLDVIPLRAAPRFIFDSGYIDWTITLMSDGSSVFDLESLSKAMGISSQTAGQAMKDFGAAFKNVRLLK